MIQTIVGISFRPTKNEKIQVGTTVQIIHDKTNQYSGRAIGIQFEGQILGYIGEKGNIKHEEIFNVLPLEGKVTTIARLGEGESFGKFKEGEITHLEIEFQMASDHEGQIQSFNEGIYLKFLKDNHKYVYDGKELISATRYIKKWIMEFDQEKLSEMCANKYGCTQQQVLDFWDGNGKVASQFGTAIHNALEHYEKFKQLGEIVQNQKGLPFNKALPSHPTLRAIVEDFYKQELQPGEVLTEVLVTNVERGLCGSIDRLLITGEKRCRVQDYKVNIGAAEPDNNMKFLGQMAELPKTKLSKYQLQLSFYATLLALSGWTVEGLDVFVYEDGWKHYELEILSLDLGKMEKPVTIPVPVLNDYSPSAQGDGITTTVGMV